MSGMWPGDWVGGLLFDARIREDGGDVQARPRVHAYTDPFDGSLRAEYLNPQRFPSPKYVRACTREWKRDYNKVDRESFLGSPAVTEFVQKRKRPRRVGMKSPNSRESAWIKDELCSNTRSPLSCGRERRRRDVTDVRVAVSRAHEAIGWSLEFDVADGSRDFLGGTDDSREHGCAGRGAYGPQLCLSL